MTGDYEMHCDEDGMLVFEYSETNSSGGGSMSAEAVMKVLRVDYGRILGTISGTSTGYFEEDVVKMNASGEFTGDMQISEALQKIH